MSWTPPPPPPAPPRRSNNPEAVAESGVVVDVNAAGLRKPIGEVYPSADFLQMFHRRGVPIILSSDAHAPEDIGRGYEQALEAMAEWGVREIAVFDGRRRRLEPVGRSDAAVREDSRR